MPVVGQRPRCPKAQQCLCATRFPCEPAPPRPTCATVLLAPATLASDPKHVSRVRHTSLWAQRWNDRCFVCALCDRRWTIALPWRSTATHLERSHRPRVQLCKSISIVVRQELDATYLLPTIPERRPVANSRHAPLRPSAAHTCPHACETIQRRCVYLLPMPTGLRLQPAALGSPLPPLLAASCVWRRNAIEALTRSGRTTFDLFDFRAFLPGRFLLSLTCSQWWRQDC